MLNKMQKVKKSKFKNKQMKAKTLDLKIVRIECISMNCKYAKLIYFKIKICTIIYFLKNKQKSINQNGRKLKRINIKLNSPRSLLGFFTEHSKIILKQLFRKTY